MLTNLDKLLLMHYAAAYQSLHYRLYGYKPRYLVVSLNEDSVLSSETVASLSIQIPNDRIYAVLYNEEPVCYFNMRRKKRSLISNELIVRQLGIGTIYDTLELIQAITCFCLWSMYERKLYNVTKIWFYLNRPYMQYPSSEYVTNEYESLDLENLQYCVDNRYATRTITNKNMHRLDDFTLQCIGALMLNNTDLDYLRNFRRDIVNTNRLNLVYNNSNYPVAIVRSVTDNDSETICGFHGDTTCLNSYIAQSLLFNDRNYRALYIDDKDGICAGIPVVKDYMRRLKYICNIPVTKYEYQKLGDTICNV